MIVFMMLLILAGNTAFVSPDASSLIHADIYLEQPIL